MSSDDTPTVEFARWLQDAVQGDEDARERLCQAVYEDLRQRATRQLRGERAGHTLQTTALVHEAWLKLVDQDWAGLSDRTHFLAIAATCMRRVLVDHARARDAVKRGGGEQRVDLEQIDPAQRDADQLDMLALDESLDRLASEEPRQARVVEMRLFAGLSNLEAAEALGVSHATVERDLAAARAFLRRELRRENAPD